MTKEEVLLTYPKILRQSTISTADICSYRLKYNLDPNQPRSSSVMRAAGTGYHAGLGEFYNQVRQGTGIEEICWEKVWEMAQYDLDREFGRTVKEDGTIVYDPEKPVDWRYQPKTAKLKERVFTYDETWTMVQGALAHYFDNNLFWPLDRYEVLGVEQYYKFGFPLREGWEMTGTMDLIVRDTETGWVHVVDHKMTKKRWTAYKAKPHNSPQAAWYMYATMQLFGTDAVTFNYDVLNIEPDFGFNRIDAHRSQETIDATLERADLVAELIENGGPLQPNVASYLCSDAYCDYWNQCPFGSRLHG